MFICHPSDLIIYESLSLSIWRHDTTHAALVLLLCRGWKKASGTQELGDQKMDTITEDFSTDAKANMKARSQRRDNLLRLIGSVGEDIVKDHLLGLFMMKYHVSLSTTYQYLQELKMAQLVAEDGDGHVLPMEQYLKEQDKNIERLKELTSES